MCFIKHLSTTTVPKASKKVDIDTYSGTKTQHIQCIASDRDRLPITIYFSFNESLMNRIVVDALDLDYRGLKILASLNTTMPKTTRDMFACSKH